MSFITSILCPLHIFLHILRSSFSLFQAFGWWGAGKKLGRRRIIDEGKNGAPAPVSPRFFPLVFLFVLAAYDSTCSPLSKRLEQASLLLAHKVGPFTVHRFLVVFAPIFWGKSPGDEVVVFGLTEFWSRPGDLGSTVYISSQAFYAGVDPFNDSD